MILITRRSQFEAFQAFTLRIYVAEVDCPPPSFVFLPEHFKAKKREAIELLNIYPSTRVRISISAALPSRFVRRLLLELLASFCLLHFIRFLLFLRGSILR